ncbi:hypothetical protein M405DRAFT_929343 [Rhizopogon salebrosus TDB-379]|nr:hypothetical protein M405DRAFT_929343 [Rhizopogon salebrosus TDB-379]
MQWEGHGAVARTHAARAESSSEAASLNGHKALTPILAGSICGGVLALAWIAALVWYLLKRRRKGRNSPKDTNQTERYIIPPDPATFQGYVKPDEHSAHVSVR